MRKAVNGLFRVESSAMFDPIPWLDECESALIDADRLAVWLGESHGEVIGTELDAIRVRIAVLRAGLSKARAELRGAGGPPPNRRWGDGSPWPHLGRS